MSEDDRPRHRPPPEAAPEAAALPRDPLRRPAARARLLRLRHVHLVASDLPSLTQLLAAQGRPELGPARRPRPAARRAQPAEPRDRHPQPDPADRQGGGDLDRGQALPHQQRRRHPRHRPRLRPGRRPQRQRPGRLDDRAAVHQERPPGPVAPHDLREAQGGRARLSALAQVVQGKDHHRVPEHDLLRQRRLRHRVGRADLLRPRRQPPRLRHAQPPALRRTAAALGGGAARRDHPIAERVRPRPAPGRGAQRGATSCCARCSSRAI